MLVLEVLFVGLGVWHHAPTYGALEGEGLHGSLLLFIGIVTTLLLSCLLGLVLLL